MERGEVIYLLVLPALAALFIFWTIGATVADVGRFGGGSLVYWRLTVILWPFVVAWRLFVLVVVLFARGPDALGLLFARRVRRWL